MHVARHLGDALNAYKGREYPAVDFFLRDVSERLISAFAGDEDASDRCYATIQSCWDQIVKANGKRGMVRREIWPIGDSESWRIDADQLWALAADNIALTGNATTFSREEVSPDVAQRTELATEREKLAIRDLDKALGRTQTVTTQVVSHESLREARRELHLAKMYFDERVQRYTAVDADTVAHLPVMTKVEKKRAGLSFSSVPWQVQPDEAEHLLREFACVYKSIPWLRGKKVGNCNSIAQALFVRAVEIDAGMGRYCEIHLPKRSVVHLGSGHDLKLPRSRIVTK